MTLGGHLLSRAPAGDFDYEARGKGYALRRRADPRIATVIHEALGSARTVLNVGAGAGSYEPADRQVTAVEPSARMRAQRPAGLAPAVIGVAEALPFDDRAFDAAMALITVHQWPDLEAGLAQMRRVTRGPVVVMTFDPEALDRFWMAPLAPELLDLERRRYPALARIASALGGKTSVRSVPIPFDCTDGFAEAFYGRPERLLDPAVRGAQSAWSLIPQAAIDASIQRLAADLASGAWDDRHGHLRTQASFDGSLRPVISEP